MAVQSSHGSSYDILLSNTVRSTYDLCVASTHRSTYKAYVGSLHHSSYFIMRTIKSTHRSSYLTYIADTDTSEYLIKNTNTVSNTFRSTYLLLGVKKSTHTSSYKIQTDNTVSSEHTSVYAIVDTNIRGITDRFCGLWNAWDKASSDRSIHLHLFNTFVSEKTAAYERSYTLASQKDIVVQRVIISDDRTIFYEVYDTYSNDRRIRFGSYSRETSDVDVRVSAYQTYTSDRSIRATKIFYTSTERPIAHLAIYNTYRYCYAKSWHVSEKWCVTHAKEKSQIASQRSMWAQIDDVNFESIRSIMLSVCSLSFDLVINPINTEWQYLISELPEPLFQSTVTPDTSQFINIPINTNLDKVDILIIEKGQDQIHYCGRESLIFQPFRQISTNTYKFDGYICPLKDVAFIKLTFEFINIGDYENSDEYYKYLISHGYLKIVIGDEEMSNNEATIIDMPKGSLINFEIYALDDEIQKENVCLKFKWAYPYTSLKMNEIMFVATLF